MSPRLRVLAPVADPGEAGAVQEVLSRVLAGGDAEVVLLGVVTAPSTVPLDAPELLAEVGELEGRIRSAAARAGAPPSVRVVVARDAWEAVEESLEGFDLLAISTRLAGAGRRLLGGSPAREVAERRGIPVLIWPSPGGG